MKPLRVLHLDSGATWRGGQRQVLLLMLGLRERGHEPFLIGVPDSPLVKRARDAGLAVGAFPMHSDLDVRAARRIRARMRTWAVDMVHSHDARTHALAMIALIAEKATPLVVTRRVPFPPKSVRLKYGERVSRFIAISGAVRDAMVAGGVDRGRITVVHSGIAARSAEVPPRDWRSELQWPSGTVVCGVVGAMTHEKGVDQLDAIGSQLSPAARSKAGIVLIGSDDARFAAGGTRIHSAGFVTEIDSAIAGLDVLLHPSRAEGLGTSVIDAMSLGIPPIAFRVGGIGEVIETDVSGLLIPPGDTNAFARATSMLIENPDTRARLAKGALARSQTFLAGGMTKGTEEVYYQVLTAG